MILLDNIASERIEGKSGDQFKALPIAGLKGKVTMICFCFWCEINGNDVDYVRLQTGSIVWQGDGQGSEVELVGQEGWQSSRLVAPSNRI